MKSILLFFLVFMQFVGKSSGSLIFDGTNDRVVVTHDASLILSRLTVSAWVKVNNFDDYNIIVNKGDEYNRNYELDIRQTTGKPHFGFTQGSSVYRSVVGNSAILTNTWTHIAGSYDGGTFRIYINGAEDNASAQTGNPDTPTDNLTLGSLLTSNLMDGNIDDVRIYNRVLSESEIKDLYACGDSIVYGLVGYWTMLDKVKQFDLSGNGNHGTHDGVTPSQDGPPRSLCASSGGM